MHATLLTLAVAVTMSAPVPKEKGKETNFFPTTLGTKWEYTVNNGDDRPQVREVVEATEKDGVWLLVIETTSGLGAGSRGRYEVRKGEIRIIESAGKKLDTPRLTMKRELRPGAKWVEVENETKGNEYSYEVGEAKEITVPAGTYTAVPVTKIGKRGPTGVLWYADGVGMIRTEDGRQVARELKSFTPGKADAKAKPKTDK